MTIVEPSDVMGGEPRLEGRRISVLQIAVPVTEGHEPEYVAEQLDITLGEVDEALDYFDNNPKQMAALREKHDEFEAALATSQPKHGKHAPRWSGSRSSPTNTFRESSSRS